MNTNQVMEILRVWIDQAFEDGDTARAAHMMSDWMKLQINTLN